MDQTCRMPDVDVHRIFDRVAHLYDTGWVQRALYAPVQDRALAELRAWRPGSVLDVGCGTGIFADRLDRELAPGGVAGCDLSAGMLAEAATRSRRVALVRGDSARLPFRPGAFDGVVCTQAFHFFDQPQAWAEFHRVLAPGGHALVGMIHPRTAIGSRRFSRLSSAGLKTEVTFPTAAEMRRLATAAGFEVIAQAHVGWRFRRIVPLVLTIGRA
ncbi:MAG TPA: methyltransferase domain-containing protein [Acidimicrobiia bacterium]|jgi:ubiquinone/menaquinone biosynthesis C-methylase UbiE|nr:methyltransferase domain-containing protein [Acidimicrobiia bacterium]